jgi:hypothetical protein
MRFRIAALLAVLVGLTMGVSGEARATVTVEFVWTSTTGAGTPGGPSIAAAPGDQLVGELRITADAGGLLAYSLSVGFDPDLGNELDLVSATELLPAGMQFNLSSGSVGATQESTASQPGGAAMIEAVNLTTAGPTSGTLVAAELTFDVTANVATDGNDVFTHEYSASGDGVGDNALSRVTPVYLHASVDALSPDVPALGAPMLGVAALLILLAGLAVLMRRHAVARA